MSHKNADSFNDKYGQQRLELGAVVRDIIALTDIPFVIENGTLISYYRHPERLIERDDDWDFALFCESEWQLDQLHQFIKGRLPKPLEVRRIDSYCDKLEVFDPTYGKYKLRGERYEIHDADFHHVTADLQLYLKTGKLYERCYPYNPFCIPESYIFPIQTGKLCDMEFSVPNDTEAFLTQVYGYLGEGAVYNEKTKKYYKA